MKIVKIIAAWAAVAVWMSIIFYLSSIVGLSSGLSWDYVLRKMAHMAEYAFLVVLIFTALATTFPPKSRAQRRRLIIAAIIIGILYAISDEIHQHYVPLRHGSPIDVAIDSVGMILAGALINRRAAK